MSWSFENVSGGSGFIDGGGEGVGVGAGEDDDGEIMGGKVGMGALVAFAAFIAASWASMRW